LINFTSKENYGLYGLGFAAVLLSVGVANALITTQMTVIVPEKKAEDADGYCFSMLLGQYHIFIPLWVVYTLGVLALFGSEPSVGSNLEYFLVLGCTILAALFHGFMRRYFYIKSTPLKVLEIDFLHLVTVLIGIVVCVGMDIERLHIAVMALYGLGALIAALAGFSRSSLPQKIRYSGVLQSVSEAWQQGRWALGGVFVTWLQSQGYVFLLAFMASTAAVAEANAAKLFIAPVGVISGGLAHVYMPKLAFLRTEGKRDDILVQARKILGVVLFSIVLLAVGILAIKDVVLEFVYSGKYDGIAPYIFAWIVVFSIQAFRSNNSMLLQVYRNFDSITKYNTLTAVVSLSLCVLMIQAWGVIGSIYSIAIGECLLAYFLWRKFSAVK
jgi:O-antigen/teichoic acid export membrane protein